MFSIRPYRIGDGAASATVFFRAVREGALADYSPDQVAAWSPEQRDAHWFDHRAADGRLVLVAEHDGVVIAYMDVEADGHIDHAYCLPEYIGTGVASRLYDAIEDHARASAMPSLYVEASDAARRLFARKGFADVRRNELVRDGVALHNVTMQKELDLGR